MKRKSSSGQERSEPRKVICPRYIPSLERVRWLCEPRWFDKILSQEKTEDVRCATQKNAARVGQIDFIRSTYEGNPCVRKVVGYHWFPDLDCLLATLAAENRLGHIFPGVTSLEEAKLICLMDTKLENVATDGVVVYRLAAPTEKEVQSGEIKLDGKSESKSESDSESDLGSESEVEEGEEKQSQESQEKPKSESSDDEESSDDDERNKEQKNKQKEDFKQAVLDKLDEMQHPQHLDSQTLVSTNSLLNPENGNEVD